MIDFEQIAQAANVIATTYTELQTVKATNVRLVDENTLLKQRLRALLAVPEFQGWFGGPAMTAEAMKAEREAQGLLNNLEP